jgi:hypothetical protein
MLIGYVSDERYVAIPGVHVDIERDGQPVAFATSTARGALCADIPPGEYQVTLVRDGFGSKVVSLRLGDGQPHQFRLLSDCLLGYVWPKWVRTGERSEFRVHSVEPYRLSLWRYGWRKEPVRLLGRFDEHGPRAVMQITPDGDYTQTGVRWNSEGYGNPDLTQFVTASERSGLYYLHAEAESGATFAFPWVVAPMRPRTPVAVLASTNTWNAYNNFGGRSNYINATSLPPRPVVNARQEMIRYQQPDVFDEWGFPDDQYQPISFERPEPCNDLALDTEVTDPIRGRQQCHLAPAEWRLLAWLEREGFAYDLYADHQLHAGQLDLSGHRVLIISTHPEYWSREMFRRVKRWVDHDGGRLVYLGGNGLNCEIEYLDAGTMHVRDYLNRQGGALGMADPDDPAHYLESRFHRAVGTSEASLLGVVTTHTGIMTAAPYQVQDASHWAFAGTGLRNGDSFGEASLHERVNGGASGHETDKMSVSSPTGTRRLAKGQNPDDGGAEIVAYETVSGGAVFSVGSITYPASLLVDEAVSRVTANVLSRFLAPT